ncbi:hypothetical protein BATDEDRAFT_21867 [Batrachochytrium dendrobatidis JAM81]|uniref:Uncharacterized protein n=1 Tax=Batrachochytrium dendrobatidis (strain JAM81 / FGSC 10211) TaxID=684364 RepID=F4NVN2_BATDJ|nr:uncharacterized protein BATDEDRAFT_21867 [Batrachochytrium dendrobatidis JAM81]EGF84114.1 hypothetical protein BATDEDRAFT_21867 [Batrachochytrium dendrobatidis JAM81]|eukprot:XP_006675402.1 hypothetical protein BATDEDRAFT_21867 [Batrachochytrium dendrobatidis JAM81]
MVTAIKPIFLLESASNNPPPSLNSTLMQKQPKQPTTIQRIMSAGMGAVLTSLLMTPFDVVKTRLQSEQAAFEPNLNKRATCPRYFLLDSDVLSRNCKSVAYRTRLHNPISESMQGLNLKNVSKVVSGSGSLMSSLGPTLGAEPAASILSISRNEGFRALWRGLTPTLIMSIPSTTVYYIGYDFLREAFGRHMSHMGIEAYAPLVAGALARIISATVISPIELVRTRMQAGDSSMRETMQGISNHIKSNGLQSLFRGLLPTLWRDVPFSAIYWVGYEQIKKELVVSDKHGNVENELKSSFIAGSVSGSISAILTHPFDVVKTLQQISHTNSTKSLSMLASFHGVLQQSGWRGLFTGLVPRFVKVAPACGIMISSYEFGKRLFSGYYS